MNTETTTVGHDKVRPLQKGDARKRTVFDKKTTGLHIIGKCGHLPPNKLNCTVILVAALGSQKAADTYTNTT